FCTVTSPISGIVESVSVEKNGMAAAGNPAYIISNKESMTVTFFVAEKAKNVLNIGDPITIERNEHIYDGAITEIGTMASAQTKLFQVKASIAGAGVGENALPNGVSVKVYATTEKEDSKLVIPYDSIYFSAGDAYVYCVENGQIVRKEVTVGLMSDEEAVIEEGLTEDSQVVSNWSSKLRNGVEADVVSVNGEAAVTDEPAETQETEAENEEAEDDKEAADSEGTEDKEAADNEETADGEDVTGEAE
ncbi:MAG: HlyD family efflux transporter periplasmic adaptor subunit, partial [Lachnospiraceae bacterium]|nr:HlyD family efflux transporter periplasmic adaptor subunit [Lachnospiraceae bacterium]